MAHLHRAFREEVATRQTPSKLKPIVSLAAERMPTVSGRKLTILARFGIELLPDREASRVAGCRYPLNAALKRAAREFTFNFLKITLMWLRTVNSLRPSFFAMSRVDAPLNRSS